MGKLSEQKDAKLDLRVPLVHIYRNAPDPFDRKEPVPVLCFFKERNPKNIAEAGKEATCKICISLAAGKIQNMQGTCNTVTTERTLSFLQERIARLQKLLPNT
jgi:hypothetical protein